MLRKCEISKVVSNIKFSNQAFKWPCIPCNDISNLEQVHYLTPRNYWKLKVAITNVEQSYWKFLSSP